MFYCLPSLYLSISLSLDIFIRLEIFEIHTRLMRESGSLDEHVSLSELAANTTGYSGAEIAGCVRAAASYALERHVGILTMSC